MDKATQQRIEKAKERILAGSQKEVAEGNLTSMEVLAVLAYCTGVCIALQDQRTVTPELAMKVVTENIQAGNKVAIKEFHKHDDNMN